MRWRMIDVLIVSVAIAIIAGGYYWITHRDAPCAGERCTITGRPN